MREEGDRKDGEKVEEKIEKYKEVIKKENEVREEGDRKDGEKVEKQQLRRKLRKLYKKGKRQKREG